MGLVLSTDHTVHVILVFGSIVSTLAVFVVMFVRSEPLTKTSEPEWKSPF